jgi:hypothetical protein
MLYQKQGDASRESLPGFVGLYPLRNGLSRPLKGCRSSWTQR